MLPDADAKRPADAEDEAPAPARPDPLQPLQYEVRPPMFSRRQVNVFLLLLAVNTLVFTLHVCIPGLFPMIKDGISQWRQKRADEREKQEQQAAFDARLNACLSYQMPAGRLVYAEPPDDARALLASSARAQLATPFVATPYQHQSPDRREDDWVARVKQYSQFPAVLGRCEPLIEFWRPDSNFRNHRVPDTLVYLHGVDLPRGAG